MTIDGCTCHRNTGALTVDRTAVIVRLAIHNGRARANGQRSAILVNRSTVAVSRRIFTLRHSSFDRAILDYCRIAADGHRGVGIDRATRVIRLAILYRAAGHAQRARLHIDTATILGIIGVRFQSHMAVDRATGHGYIAGGIDAAAC